MQDIDAMTGKDGPSDEQDAGLPLRALEHALDRLNAIPHRYADTDFGLIETAIAALKADGIHGRTVKSAIALVIVHGGVAGVCEPSDVDVRIVDLDGIKAGDPPVELPAGIGFEELCKEAGLDDKAVRFVRVYNPTEQPIDTKGGSRAMGKQPYFDN
jgi:hypothetical protein